MQLRPHSPSALLFFNRFYFSTICDLPNITLVSKRRRQFDQGERQKKISQTDNIFNISLSACTKYLFTDRKRSLGQGDVFTPVCHSVHGEGWLPNMHHWSHDWGVCIQGALHLGGGGQIPHILLECVLVYVTGSRLFSYQKNMWLRTMCCLQIIWWENRKSQRRSWSAAILREEDVVQAGCD